MENRRFEIPIIHSFDNNYVIPAAVSFHSMLEYADPQYDYRLFVLHSDITWQNQEKLTKLVQSFPNASVEFINMVGRFEDIWLEKSEQGHLAKEMLYKLILPSIFPQYDRIIITDVDVIYQGDIAPSYFAFEKNPTAYYAGVRQINPPGTFLREYYNNCYKNNLDAEEFEQLKICGGYLVANLKQLREDDMEETMVQYLEKNIDRLPQPEQDVINFCCRGNQIIYLPLNYVVCSYMYQFEEDRSICASDPFYSYKEYLDAMEHPIQLHYATSRKPWKVPDSEKADIWYAGLEKTEFLQDYYEWWNGQSDAVPQEEMPGKRYVLGKSTVPATCKVSVVCCTYNHEKYIEKALEGILNQQTNFNFEVIVADDASKDGTQKIIRKYIEKHPDQMEKCILRTENVGIGLNYYEALSAASGEYLALCDGDDEWIDMKKLQKQVDFLEKHQSYMTVCSNFIRRYFDKPGEPDQTFDVMQYVGKKSRRFTVKELIASRFLASCTSMHRWQLRGCVPEFLKHYNVIDFPLSLIHASCGYIGLIPETMAVYNVHLDSISNKDEKSLTHQQLAALYEVNQLLHFRLSKIINDYLKRGKKGKTAGQEQAFSVDAEPNYAPLSAKQKFLLLYHDKCPEWMKKICRVLVPKKIRERLT